MQSKNKFILSSLFLVAIFIAFFYSFIFNVNAQSSGSALNWIMNNWVAGRVPMSGNSTSTLTNSPIFVRDNKVGIGNDVVPQATLDISGDLRTRGDIKLDNVSGSSSYSLVFGTGTLPTSSISGSRIIIDPITSPDEYLSRSNEDTCPGNDPGAPYNCSGTYQGSCNDLYLANSTRYRDYLALHAATITCVRASGIDSYKITNINGVLSFINKLSNTVLGLGQNNISMNATVTVNGLLNVNTSPVRLVVNTSTSAVLNIEGKDANINLLSKSASNNQRRFSISNNNGTTKFIIKDDSDRNLKTALSIQHSSGNVGIGVDYPSTTLHVFGGPILSVPTTIYPADYSIPSSASSSLLTRLSQNIWSGLGSYDNGSMWFKGSGFSFWAYQGNNVGTNPSFVISRNGMVGIRTSNPQSVLDVQGDVRINGVPNNPSYSLIIGYSSDNNYGIPEGPYDSSKIASITDTCDNNKQTAYVCKSNEQRKCTDIFYSKRMSGNGVVVEAYWTQYIECRPSSNVYKLRNDFGTLKFINGADLETLTLDQTGNLNLTGKLSVKELCINNDCKNSWQVTSANINNMSNLISRIGSENLSYTDGYIPLFATDTVIRNSIIYQKANGNIGIGTINPENSEGWNRVLDVYGESHSKVIVTTNNVQTGLWSHNLGFYGAPAGGIAGTKTNHPFTLITNAQPRLTIANNGNIGIGQINPQYKLDVNGDVNINGKLIVRGDIDASSNQWGACTWRKVDANRKPKQWTCEAGEYVAGIGYEDNEWTNNNDIHIYPEVDQLYCCKI
jgi:hypothetical protein